MSLPFHTIREPYSYLVYKDPFDGMYKAKNGLTGMIVVNANADEIINKCAKDGGKICLKAGSWPVVRIKSEKPVLLVGEGPATKIIPTKNVDPIDFTNIKVRDLVWVDRLGLEHDETFVKKSIEFAEKMVVSVTEVYLAKEEKTLIELNSSGLAIVVHDGDGNPTLETRVYVDGELKESCLCNKKAIFNIVFQKKIEVKVYSEIEQEAKRSSIYLSSTIIR